MKLSNEEVKETTIKIIEIRKEAREEVNKEWTEKIQKNIEFWNREKPNNLKLLPEKLKEIKTEDIMKFCRDFLVEELKNLLESEVK